MPNGQTYRIIAASGFSRVCSSDSQEIPLRDAHGMEFNLEETFFNVFQNKVRRASRYVKFANLAAHQCLKSIDLQIVKNNRVGLYLGTGIGNSPDIVGFTAEIFANHATTVSPGSFVNTVSNAGLFYAARQFGVECTTSVVSQETLSFETALLSAVVALRSGEVDVALVGGVDVYHPPRSTMYERLHSKMAEPLQLGEGAAFVALVQSPIASSTTLGRLEAVGVERLTSDVTNHEWLKEKIKFSVRDVKARSGFLGFGVDLGDGELSQSAHSLNLQAFPTRRFTGDYSTGAAFALVKFLSQNEVNYPSVFYHFNRHHEGLAGNFQVGRVPELEVE